MEPRLALLQHHHRAAKFEIVGDPLQFLYDILRGRVAPLLRLLSLVVSLRKPGVNYSVDNRGDLLIDLGEGLGGRRSLIH